MTQQPNSVKAKEYVPTYKLTFELGNRKYLREPINFQS